MFTTIISTQELHQNLYDPGFVIIDCRFDLAAPKWGYADYLRAHIPGSVYADLNQDLSSPVTPDSGRHPLPNEKEFTSTMSRFGIDSSKQVVVVDTVAGAFAARLWWMLRLYGHFSVAVLEGGFGRWENEKRPISEGVEANSPSIFSGTPSNDWFITTTQLESLYQDPTYRVIDARAAPRYRGEVEPIDPVAGHIPGAVNRFHTNNLTRGGLFASPEILREQFLQILNGVSPDHTIVYCGSGVTSCFHLLAMEMAGLKGARLYPGSWSEWIRDPRRPIARLEPPVK